MSSRKIDALSHSLLDAEQQLLALKSSRLFFRFGFVVFFVFITPVWWRDGFLSFYTLEFAAFLLGTALLEIFFNRSLKVCLIISTVTLGLVFLFGFLHFGPNLGMGFIGLAWVVFFVNIFGAVWLPCIIVTLITLSIGALDTANLAPNWGIDYGIEDWLRMSTTVAIFSLAIGVIMNRLRQSLESARESEAEAIRLQNESEKSLMQSQRLEGIGRLAGGVAHDFNNSLSVIVAGIDALRAAKDEASKIRLLANIEQAANTAKATTSQLLSLSKQGSAPELASNPKQALLAMLPNVRRLFPENISLETELDDTADIKLSSGKFQQLILNLCLNCRDAMPDGGVISIACNEADNKVHVCVKDSGMGMDASTIEHATTAFFTTHSKGTGLGLALVKETMDSVGGEMLISSEKDRGASVHLYFPLTKPIESKDRVERRHGKQSTASFAKRLLIVEDNLELRQMYADVLLLSGFTVKTAGSAAEAQQLIDEHDLDILLTDAVLPDGDASSVILHFRKKNQGPVLVCSGYLDSEQLLADVSSKEYRFIQKPFPLRSLINILNDMTEPR